MPQDHPDGTVPTVFSKADVKVPVDIQAQYITLDVDITAQTVGNIAIDVAAQSVGNISINLAASAITLDINLAASAITLDVNLHSQTANIDIDITATSIGNLTIDIEAQSVGVYLSPDWEVKQGNQKQITGSSVVADSFLTSYVTATYTVPAGKEFYLYGVSGCGHANAQADGDLNQICSARIIKTVDAAEAYQYLGGNGGFTYPFTVPIKYEAGVLIELEFKHIANHDMLYIGSMFGFERTI